MVSDRSARLALEVVVFLDIPLGVRELALDVVFFDLHPPVDCVVVFCEQQGNFVLLQLGVFHTREDGCQSRNEILQNRMRERVSRAPEGSAQHRGIPQWKLNKGHPQQCRSDMREGSTKITRNSRVCWRPRGLGEVHLLPLDPGIQNLHHEGRLLLGPSHILVQHARQEKELQMVGLGSEHGNDIEARGLGFVCFIDFASLNQVLIALHRVLTPYNKKVGRALQ